MYENMDYMIWEKPNEILDKITDSVSEMTDWQRAFLCGLIRERRPHKLLEIGVAEGGTSAVILNCISELGLDTEVHSIDLSVWCWNNRQKKTGYLLEEAKTYLKNKVNHTLHIGGYSVEYLDEIGDGIDFLILDTVHALPGEILDFLACFPYLSKDAIVVLHDINMHHIDHRYYYCYATQLLIDCVVADKIIGEEKEFIAGLPNIGAFKVTDDTGRYITNVFMALGISWQYKLAERENELYRDWYSRYYDEECVRIYDRLTKASMHSVSPSKHEKLERFCQLKSLLEQLDEIDGIYIYGAGYYGRMSYELLSQLGYDIRGYVISDDQQKPGDVMQRAGDDLQKAGDDQQKPGDAMQRIGDDLQRAGDVTQRTDCVRVVRLSELEDKENANVFVCVSKDKQEEIRKNLSNYSFKGIIYLSNDDCGLLNYYI